MRPSLAQLENLLPRDLSPPTCDSFFFNDTATTEIYTLSLHDALPISTPPRASRSWWLGAGRGPRSGRKRSEEHTSELQSQSNLVCRLLLEKKKNEKIRHIFAQLEKILLCDLSPSTNESVKN